MRDYTNRTREELVEIIHDLEAKLEKSSSPESKCPSKEDGRFREQYGSEILDSFPDMICVYDYDLNFIELLSAPGTNHIEGFTAGGSSVVNLKEMVPEDAYNAIKANADIVIRTQKSSTGLHSLMFKGELHHYENRICPLSNNYLLCVCRDVTRRVNSEKQTRIQRDEIIRLNSLMGAILDNVPVYLYVKDVNNDFRFLYWNKEIAKQSGIPAEKVIGKTDFEVFPNINDGKTCHKSDLMTKNEAHLAFEEEYTTVTGERRSLQTTKLIVNLPDGESYLIGISWDITTLKETEQELVAARKLAEEADSLKSSFLANMSHEIRTPLNAVVGFSRLVMGLPAGEEREDYCRIIEKNSDVLLTLFNDILDLSSLEAGVMTFTNEDFDLYTIFKESYDLYSNKVEDNVQLIFDDVDDSQHVVCDRKRLLQVLANLLSNAVKFTHTGEIRLGYRLDGDKVLCYVKDTGVGIPPNKLASVFQRFSKVDNFVQGSGLGLALCRMILDHMNGNIWVESDQKIGTTMYFTLPLQ